MTRSSCDSIAATTLTGRGAFGSAADAGDAAGRPPQAAATPATAAIRVNVTAARGETENADIDVSYRLDAGRITGSKSGPRVSRAFQRPRQRTAADTRPETGSEAAARNGVPRSGHH